MNISQIQRAKLLLAQAMSAASGTSNSSVLEAQRHMKQAIAQLERVEEKQTKKKADNQTQYQQWWGQVQSGAVAHPMNPEAQQWTLEKLNSMIAAEQKKLDDLEKITDLDLVDELLQERTK